MNFEKIAFFVENSTVFLYFYIFVSNPLARIFYFLHIKLEFPKKIRMFDKIFSKFYLLIRTFVVSYWVEKNYFSNKIFITEVPSNMAIERKKQSMDGNTAAAHVSYAFTEVAQSTPLLLRR